MSNNTRLNIRQTLLHGTLGALAGGAFISLSLAFNVLGSGFLLDWAQGSVLHASVLLYKPMMLCFVAGLAWSAWRQLEAQAEGSPRRAQVSPVRSPFAVSRR